MTARVARYNLRRLVVYFMAAGTIFFWGASFPLTKVALNWLGPTSIAFLRWAISAALLSMWVVSKGKLPAVRSLLSHETRSVVWVALTGITLFYFLENLALRYTTAINAGVLSNLTTVFMVLIGTVWLHERLAGIEWAAMAVAFIGAVLVSQGSGHLQLGGQALIGDLLMVVAPLFAALYSVGGKRLVAGYPADAVTATVALVGALFLLPLALWEGLNLTAAGSVPPAAWGILLLLGLGSGALANLFWMNILSYTDASRAGMILFLIPVVSTALAVILLAEPLPLTVLLGGALVLVGVVIVQRNEAGTGQSERNRP